MNRRPVCTYDQEADMPRNNSRERRIARRVAAEAARQKRTSTGAIQSNQLVLSVEEQAREVIEEAALRYVAPELLRQISHQCGKPLSCSLHPKACSAVNQNMPPHLIKGQIDN